MVYILLIVYLPLLCCVIVALKFIWRVEQQKRKFANMPGPRGWPIVGNLFQVPRSAETFPNGIVEQANEFAANGLAAIWLVHRCFVTPNNGKTVKAIVDSTEEINKGSDYDHFLPWLGKGLLLKSGDDWRQRRRLLTPTFHFSQLDSYVTAMNRHSKVLVDDIIIDHVGEKIDLYPLIKLCTLDIICETAMGKELDSQRRPDQPYVRAVSEMAALIIEFVMNAVYWTKTMRVLVGKQQELERLAGIAKGFTAQVIAERSVALANGEVEENRRTFLDLLLMQSGDNRLSNKELEEEVETFMFEGHDTTASGLAWSVWCLACNPEMQEEAAREVLDVFGDDIDDEATKERLHSMNYLERCIKEAMRLFPPVPAVTRNLQQDFECGDCLIPKGATMFICPLAIHRNEAVFKDALKYDPDRFLPERSIGRHPYDYIPFSAGPRNCIGQRFAMSEEKVVLSWLLRRYRFAADMTLHENAPISEAVLRPKYGCTVRVFRR